MSVFFKFVRTVPRTLNWLALGSLGLLLGKILYLNQIPELFVGAYQLGLVVEGILGSVLASYVFYIVVVHSKELKDKHTVYPHIIGWVEDITGSCRLQLDALGTAEGVHLNLETLTLQEVEAVFGGISPHGKSPLKISMNGFADWVVYLDDFRITAKRDITKIMSQLSFLEAPLVTLLTRIDDSQHFRNTARTARQPTRATDLSAFAKDYFEYCEVCSELDRYVKDWARIWLRGVR